MPLEPRRSLSSLTAFVEAWLRPPPARVLEVGCGSGKLTRLLAGKGFDMTGLDPEAPEGEQFVRATLEDYEAPVPFDGAVAIRSLHHVHQLGRALDNLRDSLRPGARLVLFEFAVEHVDDGARRWAAEHGIGRELDEANLACAAVIRLSALRAALGERFRLLYDEPCAYLASELGRGDLVADEEAAIANGTLRPVGARIVYERGESATISPPSSS